MRGIVGAVELSGISADGRLRVAAVDLDTWHASRTKTPSMQLAANIFAVVCISSDGSVLVCICGNPTYLVVGIEPHPHLISLP